jgi:hypothetical protein
MFMISAKSGEVKKFKRKCVVLNVLEAKAWRNVSVRDTKTNEKYFFGKVRQAPPEINEGDELFIGYEDLPYDLPDGSSKIVLLSLDGMLLDWAMITPH